MPVAPTNYTCAVGSGVTSSFTCGTGSSASAITVAFNINVSTLNVNDAYTMAVHGGTTDTLTSFTNVWGDDEATLEPSTFVLLGTALTGLGFLRHRRKQA